MACISRKIKFGCFVFLEIKSRIVTLKAFGYEILVTKLKLELKLLGTNL